MNIFIVGDVHGCLCTFKELIERYWNPKHELLIQLGDLIDRGNFSAETVQFVRNLQSIYPERVIILRGNHEQEFIDYVEKGDNPNWLRQKGKETIESYLKLGLSLAEEAAWMKNLPLFWENEHIFVSHAGISQSTENPFDPQSNDGVLWTRNPLRNLGKMQIVGHTPIANGLPRYSPKSNSWYIDTGACYKRQLSAIKLTEKGQIVKLQSFPTHPRDIWCFDQVARVPSVSVG
jgi:serine/threonine protein phosphatase 1